MTKPPQQRIFRFAPSPNGFLHLGHAYSALLNFDMARRRGGRFLLRIEDIDRGRSRPDYEAAIYEDLAWLGLVWEEPVRRQSQHFGEYARALERLEALGLLYPCSCSRAQIAQATLAKDDWPRDPDGSPLYPGTCREKSREFVQGVSREGALTNRRLNMANALRLVGGEVSWREYGMGEKAREIRVDPSQWGDVVLARKNIPVSYHIAVVLDDAMQGVSDVVRGMDLFHATSVHRLLQRLLNLPEPVYRHHDLVLDEAGEKLAKRRGSKTLRMMRAVGLSPADVRRILGLADEE